MVSRFANSDLLTEHAVVKQVQLSQQHVPCFTFFHLLAIEILLS